jgi:hypothetical protein
MRTAAAGTIAPGFATLMVEKYGVDPADSPTQQTEAAGGRRPEFYAHNTVSQRAADCAQVLSELHGASWWNGHLVLFGGSEGGAVVAILAPRVREDAVIIFSTGLSMPLTKMLKIIVPPPVAAEAGEAFAKIDRAPLSAEIWSGNSYRWWADIKDRMLVNDRLKVRGPILLVQGELDPPLVGAWATRDAFAKAHRTNLTYWELEGYDHGLRDREGHDGLPELYVRAGQWLGSHVR